MNKLIFLLIVFLFSCEDGTGASNNSRTITLDFLRDDASRAQYKYLLLERKDISDKDIDLTKLKNKLSSKHNDFSGNLINLKGLSNKITVQKSDDFILLYAVNYQSFVDIIELDNSSNVYSLKPLNIVTDSLKSNMYNVLSDKTSWSFSNQELENATIIIPSTITTFSFSNFSANNIFISSSSSSGFIDYTWNNVSLVNSYLTNIKSTIKLQGIASFQKCLFSGSGSDAFLFNANSIQLSLKESIIENVPFFVNGASTDYDVENLYVDQVDVLFELNIGTSLNLSTAYIKNVDLGFEIESSQFEIENLVAKNIASLFVAFKPVGVFKSSYVETNNSALVMKIEFRSTNSYTDSILIQNTNLISKFKGNDIVIESPVETNIIFDNCFIDFGTSPLNSNVFDRNDSNIPSMGEVFFRNMKESKHLINF